jgi:hypothetical protein
MRWPNAGRSWVRTLVSGGLAAGLAASCATTQPDPAAKEWRAKLSDAIREPVASRDQRDEHSRVLIAAIDHDAIVGLTSDQVQAAFGPGEPCSGQALCAEQGFSGDDLYYAIGQPKDDKVKQLPALIVGFDTHGTVKRIYTLKTH